VLQHGRIIVDRQECKVYLRDKASPPEGYRHGWNVHYTTDLTPPVWFYVRGEEYSAELDHFVQSVSSHTSGMPPSDLNSFGSAAVTDRVIELMIHDAGSSAARTSDATRVETPARPAQGGAHASATRAKPRSAREWARARLAERRRRRAGRLT